MSQLTEVLTTCAECDWTWDARTWTRCPRCMGRTKAYEPTPSEIRASCLAIQKTWSPTMKRARCASAYRVDVEIEITIAHGGPSDAKRDYLDRD
jgi:hypothetical protein